MPSCLRIAGLFLIALCAATPALAAPRDEALAGISRCYGLTDDRALLDCIYGAAQPLRAELGLPPANPAQIRLVPPELSSSPPPPSAAVMARASGALHMASYSFDTTGIFTVTLSNGEVWRQTSDDIKHARWRKPAAGYGVTVTQDFLGGYKLNVLGDHTYFVQKVK